ncbi:endonuclease MutS2 [Rhodocaloribacter sp.]
MKRYPSTIEEKLGFDVLRARMEGYARSTLGLERLARMRPSDDLAWVRDELARVSEFQEALRFDDPIPLEHVLDLREVLRRVAPEGSSVGPEDLLATHRTLTTTRRLKAYFEARRDRYPHLAERVRHITPLVEIEAYVAGIVDDEGRVRDGASPELRRIRREIGRRQAQLRASVMRALRDAIAQGYATEEQPTLRNGRMVIPVRAEAKRKVQGFVHDVSSTGQTVYVEPTAALDLNNAVRELEGEERREVERILRAATAELRAHLDELRENQRSLAAFDLLQAKARLALDLDAAVPRLNDEGVIDIREGRNPVLQLHFARLRERGGEPRAVVPLDLGLGEAYRTLVITGPNAGGKSVAMKTVGLFALMLAYGLPLPLDPRSRFSLFADLIVDIGDEQSIEEDLSTFSSHVANLKYMLRRASDRALILIDEAGTGTDPAEGGALAQAVLERLTDVGARTIATTHHGTLKVFAHETEGVENGSMEFDQETLRPTYRFRPGVPGSSYAFEIAERIGLDREILDRARELVGTQKAKMEDLIAVFERRNQELARRLAEAEAALAQAKTERAKYEERLERLREQTDAIRQRALAEAERIVREANARVEQTIREIREAEAAKAATQAARARLEGFKEEVAGRREKVERRQKKRKRGSRKKRPAETPAAPAPGPIRVGDQVVIDGGGTAGEVLELDAKEAVIAVGAMRMRVRRDRLTKVGGPRRQEVTVRHVAAAPSGLAAMKTRTHIDLRGARVDEALAEVTRFLDEAVAAGLDRVEILHGKGTGALRQAIHTYLAARPDVAAFEDAPWNQGGAGVTVVTLK